MSIEAVLVINLLWMILMLAMFVCQNRKLSSLKEFALH